MWSDYWWRHPRKWKLQFSWNSSGFQTGTGPSNFRAHLSTEKIKTLKRSPDLGCVLASDLLYSCSCTEKRFTNIVLFDPTFSPSKSYQILSISLPIHTLSFSLPLSKPNNRSLPPSTSILAHDHQHTWTRDCIHKVLVVLQTLVRGDNNWVTLVFSWGYTGKLADILKSPNKSSGV